MFAKKISTEMTGLEETIERVHVHMGMINPASEDYAKMADSLTKLYKLREHDTVSSNRPSPDVIATIAAHLLGIAMIVGHERAHVVTSKALSFVMKLK